MRKINEIFYSIQGEGCHAGIPSVFIRFSGCNFKCEFCDTRHEEGELFTDEEIIERIKEFPARWVILTGGEPSLWIDEEFVEKIKNLTGMKVAIETNGSHQLPENLDWITVSPKIGVAGANDYNLNCGIANELKVVETGQDLSVYFNLPCVSPYTRMLLQPCFEDNEEKFRANIKRTVERVMKDPRWRLSLQTHRFIGIQ